MHKDKGLYMTTIQMPFKDYKYYFKKNPCYMCLYSYSMRKYCCKKIRAKITSAYLKGNLTKLRPLTIS